MAEFDLATLGYDYQGSLPLLTAPWGDGHVEANLGGSKASGPANGGSSGTQAGVLRLRFLSRDKPPTGPRPLTAGDGSVQETEIGDVETNFAEIIHLRIDEVDPADPDGPPLPGAHAKVAIRELLNTKWTQLFFDGAKDTTDCTGANHICNVTEGTDWRKHGAGQTDRVRLDNGSVEVTLASNASPRLRYDDRTLYLPTDTLFPRTWPDPGCRVVSRRHGRRSAARAACSRNSRDTSGRPESELRVSQWVDERSLVVSSFNPSGLPNCEWAWSTPSGGNSVRDWLEAKSWDFTAIPQRGVAWWGTPKTASRSPSLSPPSTSSIRRESKT